MKNVLPSPAMIVACLALAVALGGAGYAATMLPANSVGGAQIRSGSITSGKVRDGSLLTRDFAVGQLPAGRKGDTGAKGDPGATGDAGPAGPKGEPGATKAVARIGSAPNIPTGKEGSLDIACEPGERATGGGAGFFGTPSLSDHLRSSFPVRLIRDAAGKPTGGIASVTNGGPADGWEVTGVNGGIPRDFVGWVICVST